MDSVNTNATYRFDYKAPCNNAYINPVILKLCQTHGVQRILDLGCGNGSLCRELVDAGFQVSGVEPSRDGIAAARRLVPQSTFYEMSVYDVPGCMPECRFDAVVSTEVIEHLFRPRALPLFAGAKLRAGGILMVSTPYHGFLKNLAISLMNGWDSHHTPLWDGGHIKFWSRNSLTQLLHSCGFEVLGFHGVGRLPFFWKSMILVARQLQEVIDAV